MHLYFALVVNLMADVFDSQNFISDFIHPKTKQGKSQRVLYKENLNFLKPDSRKSSLFESFSVFLLDVTDFVMAAIHTSPSQAVSEIDRLVDVYDDIVRRWNLNDVIILGDFNAGCSYVTKSAWEKIRLAKDRRFYWLFPDHVDTTVANSDCPYDRYIS